MTDDLAFRSALELKALMRRGVLSPVELAEVCLARLDQVDRICNVFATVTADRAMDAARRAEAAYMRGEGIGLLSGLPVSVKELVPVAGLPHTFGSRAFAENRAGEDAPVVERVGGAGACLLGKTTTDEFGCKAVGHSSLRGWTLNPWDVSRTPGGSSCGAAASVAAGVTPFAIGTDGGGSVRIPASFTSLFAIKPQLGRIPVFPPALAPTLFHIGPMARTVRDAALLLAATAGYDDRDPAAVSQQPPDFLAACDSPVKGLRIAWSRTLGYASPEPPVVELCDAALGALEREGCIVETVEGPFQDDPLEVWMAEFFGGAHARLKGTLEQQPEAIDPAVRSMIEAAGGRTLGQYYENAFKRQELRESVRRFMQGYDLLATPTLPLPPFESGHDVPPSMPGANLIGWTRYTYPFNLTGQPAASVPAGYTEAGLPVGLQLVAHPLREEDIFTAAAALERVRPWSGRRPELGAASGH